MDVRRVGVDMQSHYEGTGASPILLNLSEGELRAIESIGDITVIGHTWKAGNAGHSIAEPVFVGAPVFFGKYVGFHKPYARVIVSAGAGLRINNLDQLAKKILETVNDPQRPRLRSMRRATATAADRIDQQISGPILNALFTDWLKIPTSSKTLRAA